MATALQQNRRPPEREPVEKEIERILIFSIQEQYRVKGDFEISDVGVQDLAGESSVPGNHTGLEAEEREEQQVGEVQVCDVSTYSCDYNLSFVPGVWQM